MIETFNSYNLQLHLIETKKYVAFKKKCKLKKNIHFANIKHFCILKPPVKSRSGKTAEVNKSLTMGLFCLCDRGTEGSRKKQKDLQVVGLKIFIFTKLVDEYHAYSAQEDSLKKIWMTAL